jgi:hypothetical protein
VGVGVGVLFNPGQKAQGEVLLDISFKVFEDDKQVRVCVRGEGWWGVWRGGG